MSKDLQSILRWEETSKTYVAPGLVDLQVNGANGIDFNDLSLTEADVLKATEYLVSRGITTYFPTVITNSDASIKRLFKVLSAACETYPLVKNTVGGFHLEGPFISPKDGARGAHDIQFVKPPQWEIFHEYQKAAKGNIRLITISPEWEQAPAFIKKCKENNVMVSMGHSMANTHQIKTATEAGLVFSTHLGNGAPPMLKRHPNMIWDQLGEDKLMAMIIADGHHLPDNFIKVVLGVKGENVILVSDMTRFAGMLPGEYKTFIGGNVVLDKYKRLAMNDGSGLLAGAAKDLLECVETLVKHKLCTLAGAWNMASVRVKNRLESQLDNFSINIEDQVEFQMVDSKIKIKKVKKGKKTVYGKENTKDS